MASWIELPGPLLICYVPIDKLPCRMSAIAKFQSLSLVHVQHYDWTPFVDSFVLQDESCYS